MNNGGSSFPPSQSRGLNREHDPFDKRGDLFTFLSSIARHATHPRRLCRLLESQPPFLKRLIDVFFRAALLKFGGRLHRAPDGLTETPDQFPGEGSFNLQDWFRSMLLLCSTAAAISTVLMILQPLPQIGYHEGAP